MTTFEDARVRWDRRYGEADALFGDKPNAWLAAHAHLLPADARVLSLADGQGRNGVWLAQRGCQVTAFDLSPIGIEQARRRAREIDVAIDLSVTDIADWTWAPDAFDAVVGIFFQFASPELRKRIFAGVARTLVPGGVFVLEGYGLRQLEHRTGGPGVAENLYTMPMLLQAFEGWRIDASRDLDADLAEGSDHVGRSHLLSMVLRKPA
jgi:SAM-dependent methyltransferase